MSEVKMDRVEEIAEGRVAIIGEKSINRDIFCHVMRAVDRSFPTVVLCRSKSEASYFARETDVVVPIGCFKDKNEFLLEVFEPFLCDPSFSHSVEGIIEEIVESFFDSGAAAHHDPYWTESARSLFEEVMRYVLLSARQENNFSVTNIAKLFQLVTKTLPETLSGRKNSGGMFDEEGFKYPDELWVNIGKALGEEPFKKSLINVPAVTAGCVLSSYNVAAKRLTKFLLSVSNKNGEGVQRYSLKKALEEENGKAIILYPSQSVRIHAPIFFESALRAVGVFSKSGKARVTLVVPNVDGLKNMGTLCSLLEDDSSSISIIWGCSSLNAISSFGDGEKNVSIVKRMIALSDGQAWSRLSDTFADELYKGFIPETSRIYALPSIPKRLCFIRSDRGEFDSVTVPASSAAPAAKEDNEGARENVSFWKDSPPIEFAGKKRSSGERPDAPSESREAKKVRDRVMKW